MSDLKLEIQYKDINSIVGYVNNTRVHPQEQVEQIKASIKEFGMCNPIGLHNNTILFGHGRWEALKQLKYKEVPTIDLSHLTEAQKKALIIADNKIALNSEWDEDLLKLELQSLDEFNFDYSELGMDFDFDIDIPIDVDSTNKEESPYTDKKDVFSYEITGKKPDFSEMYNNNKAKELIKKIESSSVDSEIKDFLRLSAYRFLEFNYENIAEFYAHSNKEVQEIMEDLALVIIDYNKAIGMGFIKADEDINIIQDEEYTDVL